MVIEVAAHNRDAERARGVDGAVVNRNRNEVCRSDCHANNERSKRSDVLIRLGSVLIRRGHDREDEEECAAELHAQRLARVSIGLNFIRAAVDL
jgi:hypothetical protein